MSSCSVLQQFSARQLLEQRIDFTSAPNKVVLGVGSAPIPRNVTVLESDKLRFGDSVTGSPCTSNGDALTCETSVSTTCSSASSSPASITNELTAVASPLPARSESGKSASPAPLPEKSKEQQSRPTEPVREPIKIKFNLQAIKTLTSPLVLEPPPTTSKEKREEKDKLKEERREREEKERGKLNGHLKPPSTPLTNGLVPKATSTPIQNGSAKESKIIGPVLPPGLLAKKKEDDERKEKKENGIDRTGGLKRERERDSESPPSVGAVKKARRRLLSERGEKEASYPIIDKNTISSWNWDGCNMVKGRRRGCGLVNTSNDCFLNAILQTVVHCPPLCRYIIERHTPDRCQRGKGQCVACAMRAQHIPRAVNGGGPFQPTWIRPFMKRIFPSHYHGMQEDAHELLALLLDALDPPVGGGGGGGAALPNGIQSMKPSTPIEQIFGGTLRNSVECMACGAPAVNYERIRELNLAIKRQGEDRLPLRKLIADYFQDERLQNFSCKKCSRKTAAVRRTRVLRAPAVLLVQLKRFNAFGSKIRHPVVADPRVDLSSWMFDSASSLSKEEYVLTGVVEHLGAGVDHGHYMAFARGFGGEWHLFDDDAVTAVPAQRVHNAQPYLLVYSRREHFPQLQGGAASASASNGVSSGGVQQKMNGGGGSKLVNGGGARMNGHHGGHNGMNRSFGGHSNKFQQQKSHNNSFHTFNKKQYI